VVFSLILTALIGQVSASLLAKVTNTMDDDTPTTIIFDYTYDKVGNQLTKTVDSTDVHSYGYDDIYQLLTVDYPASFFVDDTTFDYDSLGNRETMDVGATTILYHTYKNNYDDNMLNQYGSVGEYEEEVDYSYDDSGNLTDDKTYFYEYDSENRLINIENQSEELIASYEYDYSGRRIKKTIHSSSDVVKYVYDGDQVIAEYDDSDTLLRKFIYGPGIDEPICMIIPSGQANAGIYYYHYDALGSVVALSKVNGSISEIVEAYVYDVFGKCTVVTSAGTDGSWMTSGDGTTAEKSQKGNPYLFTGRRYDDESDLYYYRARMYNPEIGRFLQADPIGYADSMNLYSYVGNNPIRFIDVYGLCKGLSDEEIEDYAKELKDLISKGEIDAVEGLARLAERLAERYGGWNDDETGFVEHFSRLLTEREGRWSRRVQDRKYITNFGGTGFAERFYDGTPQQSRHFVGSMAAGYYWKLDFGTLCVYFNERNTNFGDPDWQLGMASVWLGARLKGGPIWNLPLEDVPDYIRNNFKD